VVFAFPRVFFLGTIGISLLLLTIGLWFLFRLFHMGLPLTQALRQE
jgi:hypothetical protein